MTPQQIELMTRQRNARMAAQLEAELEKRAAAEQAATDRAARARRAERKPEPHTVAAATKLMDVFQYVDTSAGPHECHPWTGKINRTMMYSEEWKAKNPGTESFDFGEFTFDGMTVRAPRAVVMATFNAGIGYSKDRAYDLHQVCGNKLCCNVEHIAIRKRGAKSGHPSEQFVCDFFGGDHALHREQGQVCSGDSSGDLSGAE